MSTASLSNPGSSYCCWQPTPVPSAGGIGWAWVRRSTGANQRRPCCVPCSSRELLEVADCKKTSEEGETWRQVDRRGGGLTSHFIWQSKNTRNLQSSHHVSFPCLCLLPVCPSFSTVGPQTHNLNDEWDGKPKASAFLHDMETGEDSVL